LFAAAVYVSVAFPIPLAGETVNHGALLAAVHEAPATLIVKLAVPLPPVAPIATVDGARVTEIPVWLTVKRNPLALIVPVRVEGLSFSAKVYVSVALPTPVVGVTVSHATLLTAVQALPAVVVNAIPPLPDACGAVTDGGEKLIAANCCVKVNMALPAVIVAVRCDAEVFAV
jgi:hypothetical protein